MAETVAVLMLLLALGFVGTKLADLMRIPHSVFLVLLGFGAAVVLRLQEGFSIHSIQELFPEIILYILLPPLIFESSYNFDFHGLKKDLTPITALAVVSLVVSTVLIGLGLNLLLELPLLPSLVFGALISATDPVAVVALFKEIGAPKRLSNLVEGESLLNDGTAIVVFRVMLGFTLVPVFDGAAIAAGIAQFFIVAFGGVLVGLVIAWITDAALRFSEDSSAAQLGLTVSAAYVSFLVADHTFHVSGVISTMTVGLFLGARARVALNKEALHGMHSIWDFLALSANSIVFFGVGLTIDPGILSQSLAFLPVTLALVYLVRAASVFAVILPMNASGLVRRISFGYQMILIWGGLRGGLALALVLTLPQDFPDKQLFLGLSAAVVLATLLVNALTIKPVMHLLGVDRLNPVDEGFYLKSLELLGQSVFEPLAAEARSGSLSAALVEEKRLLFESQLKSYAGVTQLSERDKEESGRLFTLYSLLLGEKHYYDVARENGILSRGAYGKLCRSVSERQAAFEQESWKGLEEFRFGKLERRFWKPSVSSLVLALETPLHQLFGLQEARAKTDAGSLEGLSLRWEVAVRESISAFYSYYSSLGIGVQSVYVANTVRAVSLRTIEELKESGIISEAVNAQALSNIGLTHKKAVALAKRLLNPTVEFLLGRIPLFRHLDPAVLKLLAARTQQRVVDKDTRVVTEGAPGTSMYLITAGFLEVERESLLRLGIRPKLFTGDYFGEMSLVFHQPRAATVVAMVPSVLIEIQGELLTSLMADFPDIADEIRRTAQERQHG